MNQAIGVGWVMLNAVERGAKKRRWKCGLGAVVLSGMENRVKRRKRRVLLDGANLKPSRMCLSDCSHEKSGIQLDSKIRKEREPPPAAEEDGVSLFTSLSQPVTAGFSPSNLPAHDPRRFGGKNK